MKAARAGIHQRLAMATGSSEKIVSSFMRPWRRRTHLPSLISIAGITSREDMIDKNSVIADGYK